MKTALQKSRVTFSVKGKPYEFFIIHNMSNHFGMSLTAAVNSWVVRTRSYTPDSLCRYIIKKASCVTAMTEATYNRLNK